MRGDNDGMEVITRKEFTEAINMFVTKEDLKEALAETKHEIASAFSASMADTKSDILEGLNNALSNVWMENRRHTTSRVTEAKLEILSVNKKNIADAIAPVISRLDAVDKRLNAVDVGLTKLNENIEHVNESVSERLNQQDERLTRAGL